MTETLTVTITGRNLSKLAEALQEGRCTSLQVFDPARYPVPAEGTPIIERLTLSDSSE